VDGELCRVESQTGLTERGEEGAHDEKQDGISMMLPGSKVDLAGDVVGGHGQGGQWWAEERGFGECQSLFLN
jgi:hypothetical protein